MPIDATLTYSYSVQGSLKKGNVTVSAGSRVSYSEPVPQNSADLLVAGEIDVSQLKAWYMKADQDLTIETNSGSSPADTINLTKNVPMMWHAGSGLTNPLTTDVTAFYVTEGNVGDATLEMEFLVDPTV